MAALERRAGSQAPVIGGVEMVASAADLNELADKAGTLSHIRLADVTATSAGLKALNATPKVVVAAPGAGFASLFEGAVLYKPAGTAYDGIATNEILPSSTPTPVAWRSVRPRSRAFSIRRRRRPASCGRTTPHPATTPSRRSTTRRRS